MNLRTLALLVLFVQCGCEIDEGDWDYSPPPSPEIVPTDTCGSSAALCTVTHPRWVEWSDRRDDDRETDSQVP